MAKKEEKQEMYIYAGLSVPELLLRQGKVYKEIPKLPKEYGFLKDFFVPLKEYPLKKSEFKKQFKQLRQKLIKIRKEVK